MCRCTLLRNTAKHLGCYIHNKNKVNICPKDYHFTIEKWTPLSFSRIIKLKFSCLTRPSVQTCSEMYRAYFRTSLRDPVPPLLSHISPEQLEAQGIPWKFWNLDFKLLMTMIINIMVSLMCSISVQPLNQFWSLLARPFSSQLLFLLPYDSFSESQNEDQAPHRASTHLSSSHSE